MKKKITYFNDTMTEKILHAATNCDVMNLDESIVDTIKPGQLVKIFYEQESLLIKDWGKVIMFKEI